MAYTALVLLISAIGLWAESSLAVKQFNITVGYLPCIMGELRNRQGLTISGAISMALEEINSSKVQLPDVDLLLEWHDTKCDPVIATQLITEMSSKGVVAFFGLEGGCHIETIIAQTKNLPIISHPCSDTQTSDLTNLSQLMLLAAQATKSVISLLRYYRWNKFSIVYEEPWTAVALTLNSQAKRNNMTVNLQTTINDMHSCCAEKLTCCAYHFIQNIKDTKDKARIYVFLGSSDGLIDMMTAMEQHQLFAKGLYMIISMDMITYGSRESLKYFISNADRISSSLVCPNTEEFRRRARSLLMLVPSEPASSYEQFTDNVRKYNTLPPFNFIDAFTFRYNKFVSIYAAYLYDSVKLYAKALDAIIKEETTKEPLTYAKLLSIANNGSRIIQKMVESSPYRSISGMSIRLDENANPEGNFSVLAYKSMKKSEGDVNCSYDMTSVGQFQQSNNDYPQYKVNPHMALDWPDHGVKPEDVVAEY